MVNNKIIISWSAGRARGRKGGSTDAEDDSVAFLKERASESELEDRVAGS
jgi:hypothetical protein